MLTTAAPDPTVAYTFWDIIQQAASFLVSLAVLAGAAYPVFRWWQKRRAKERAEREEQRRAEIAGQVAEAVEPILEPLRKQVDQIHRTTHINHHSSEEPTILDRFSDLNKLSLEQQKMLKQCIFLVGAVAENQARLTDRIDINEESGQRYVELVRGVLEQHGIELPQYDRQTGDDDDA